jgi:glutaredoxin
MKLIRIILGALILFFNALFSPRGIKRSDDQQADVNQQVDSLKLYQFNSCPFCVKVRRSAKRLSLPLETRDLKKEQKWEDELIKEGGVRKVPCLRIEENDQVTWMYESKDIITYLEQRFA